MEQDDGPEPEWSRKLARVSVWIAACVGVVLLLVIGSVFGRACEQMERPTGSALPAAAPPPR